MRLLINHSAFYKSLLLALLIVISFPIQTFSQCASAPAEGTFSCSGGNGAATNGVTANNTEVYWYSGTGSFATQYIVESGGTLIICGDLTLNGGLNLKGGGVVAILTGGSLTVVGNTSIDGSIYNYGNLSFSNTLTINNTPAEIINANTSSVLTVNGNFAVNGNTNLVNNGSAIFNAEVTSNANASICLGQGSSMTVAGQLRNEGANTWASPSGASCIGYTFGSNSALNQPLTSTSNINLCIDPAAGTISNYGSATYNTSCSSCSYALPIELESFSIEKATVGTNSYVCTWITASETNNDYFTIECSFDGISFSPVLVTSGQGNSNQRNTYTETIEIQSNLPKYFRLRQTDYNGDYTYSKIISNTIYSKNTYTVENSEEGTSIILDIVQSCPISIQIISNTGEIVNDIKIQHLQTGKQIIPFYNLLQGLYILQVTLGEESSSTKIMVK